MQGGRPELLFSAGGASAQVARWLRAGRSTWSPGLYQAVMRLLRFPRRGHPPLPGATARILTLQAESPAWNQFRFNMVYATSGLTSKNVVSCYFKVKKGDGEWVELNPSKAEDMATGAAIEGFWELPLPAAFRGRRHGPGDHRGRWQAGRDRPARDQLRPAFRVQGLRPVPPQAGVRGQALFAMTAYADERFLTGQVPEVLITLDGPGGELDVVKAVLDPKDVVWLNGHTLFVTGTIPKLPKWPKTMKCTRATAAVSFGNVQAAEQAYVEVTEADAAPLVNRPPEPTTTVRQPADGQPSGYQFKKVLARVGRSRQCRADRQGCGRRYD